MFSNRTIGWGRGHIAAALLAAALLVGSGRAFAAAVTQEQAMATAYAWLSLSPDAMHEQHGQLAGTVLPVRNALGETEFYAVDLTPKGFVIVAADDGVEPIIAFSATDEFEAAPGNPLYDLLQSDIPARVTRARAAHAARGGKWEMLRKVSSAPKVLTAQGMATMAGGPSASSVNDVRVPPLVKSMWNQSTSDGLPAFNYYTPPYAHGSPSNYDTGCVATMLGQIMRYHQWPQAGVGTQGYQITVNGSQETQNLRGGDGSGGGYSWANMPLVVTSSVTTLQQQAISALLADAGTASGMDYERGGSGASIMAWVLTSVFQYADADFSKAQLSTLEPAIDANLDVGLPVGLGITGGGFGHAVVADGYGYNASTVYYHLNMGWSGAANAWYNLPTIDAGGYAFDVVNGALFNVDPKVRGEIVSGRITDAAGHAASGTLVTIKAGSVIVTATTNAQGIYAAKGLSSGTKWTVTPSAGSRVFIPTNLSVTTGNSASGVGDKTGLNFTSQLITGSVTVQINAGATAAGAEWRVNGGEWQASGATVAGVPTGTGTISFRATPDWIAPAGVPVMVTQNQTTSISENYAPKYSLTVAPDNVADGQVSADPEPGDMGSYAPNRVVTLTATAAAGYYFGGWVESGTLVSTDATYTTVVKGARSLVANFPPNSLTGQDTQAYVTSNKGAAIINVLADLNFGSGSPGVLSVTQPANGTVTINQDGTLTFTPGANFHGSTVFSYTAGNGQGGTITKTVTISNWFAASAGTYAGLSLASDVTNETSGYLKVTVTSSGAFTGKLQVAGLTYVLSGAFDGNANYQTVIARPGTSNLNVSLHLDAASEITGTIGDGVTLSDIVAERVTFNATNKAPQAGKYTALLSANSAVPGNGYLLVTVYTTGASTVTGRLADGTPVSAGGCLNPDGSLPYYAGVYKAGDVAGSFLGTMVFQPAAQAQCSGTYAWFRPASTGVYYAAGFAESGEITGSLLASVAQLQSQAATTISAQLSGGGLAATIDDPGESLISGKIAWTGAGSGNLTLAVAPSGLATGTFVDPGSGKKRTLLGVWLEKQQLGGGFFLGEQLGGGAHAVGAVGRLDLTADRTNAPNGD